VVCRRSLHVRKTMGNVGMCALLGAMCSFLVGNVFPLCSPCFFIYFVPERCVWNTFFAL
jgi:hypothetical protein